MGIKVAKRIQLCDTKVPLANRIRIALASVVVCYCEEVYEEGCWFVAETRNDQSWLAPGVASMVR